MEKYIYYISGLSISLAYLATKATICLAFQGCTVSFWGDLETSLLEMCNCTPHAKEHWVPLDPIVKQMNLLIVLKQNSKRTQSKFAKGCVF